MTDDLRDVRTHFDFGKNWKSFAATVSQSHVEAATASLARLFPGDELEGARFLDIGCGSGLSMLAAKTLGAAAVRGIDIDPHSVEAARSLLSTMLEEDTWKVECRSAFDFSPDRGEQFDVVHSWGVLHHTGDMWAAVRQAAGLVRPGGYLALALYRKTPLCWAWKLEKRFYTAAPDSMRKCIRGFYKAIYLSGVCLTGRSPSRYLAGYTNARGMDWHHDVHDWLGGHPYESADPVAVTSTLQKLGFDVVRVYEKRASLAGLLGSHCDEFVTIRRA